MLNPKFQILNPKQYLISNAQNLKQSVLHFEFCILNLAYRQAGLFSALCLGFIISQPKRRA